MTEKKKVVKKPPVKFEVLIEYEYDAETVAEERKYAPGVGTVKGEKEYWRDQADGMMSKFRVTAYRVD